MTTDSRPTPGSAPRSPTTPQLTKFFAQVRHSQASARGGAKGAERMRGGPVQWMTPPDHFKRKA